MGAFFIHNHFFFPHVWCPFSLERVGVSRFFVFMRILTWRNEVLKQSKSIITFINSNFNGSQHIQKVEFNAFQSINHEFFFSKLFHSIVLTNTRNWWKVFFAVNFWPAFFSFKNLSKKYLNALLFCFVWLKHKVFVTLRYRNVEEGEWKFYRLDIRYKFALRQYF